MLFSSILTNKECENYDIYSQALSTKPQQQISLKNESILGVKPFQTFEVPLTLPLQAPTDKEQK